MDIQTYLEPLMTKLQGWGESAVAGLPNFVLAVLVMVAFLLIGRWLERFSRRAAGHIDASEAIARLMSTVARYTIVLVGFVVALGILGLQKTVVSLLAGAGVAGLAIGFAFQDLAANFIAGVAMGLRKPFEIGHVIKTGDHSGRVKEINLRNTVLETFDGQRVIIPNRQVFENPLINYQTTGVRRVEIDVGVGYETDLDTAVDVARNAIGQLDFRADDTDVQVLAHEFGASSINFRVRYWIPYPDESYPDALHDGVLAIKRAFNKHEINIPFPIRTLDLSLTNQEAGQFVVHQREEAALAA